VAPGADGGVIALDWTNAGDGALYAGDPGGESHGPETGTEAGTVETTPFGNRKARMNNHNCHFSRTDPFTDPFTQTKWGMPKKGPCGAIRWLGIGNAFTLNDYGAKF
jgi:hypothetical protein